jgi:hypothetical protein
MMDCVKNFSWVGNFQAVRQRLGNPDRKGREEDPYCPAKVAAGQKVCNFLPGSF